MTCPALVNAPHTQEGAVALLVLEQAPRRYAMTGAVVGIEWPAALAIAAAHGLEGELAAEYLAAGERGLLKGLAALEPSEKDTPPHD